MVMVRTFVGQKSGVRFQVMRHSGVGGAPAFTALVPGEGSSGIRLNVQSWDDVPDALRRM